MLIHLFCAEIIRLFWHSQVQFVQQHKSTLQNVVFLTSFLHVWVFGIKWLQICIQTLCAECFDICVVTQEPRGSTQHSLAAVHAKIFVINYVLPFYENLRLVCNSVFLGDESSKYAAVSSVLEMSHRSRCWKSWVNTSGPLFGVLVQGTSNIQGSVYQILSILSFWPCLIALHCW